MVLFLGEKDNWISEEDLARYQLLQKAILSFLICQPILALPAFLFIIEDRLALIRFWNAGMNLITFILVAIVASIFLKKIGTTFSGDYIKNVIFHPSKSSSASFSPEINPKLGFLLQTEKIEKF